MKIKYSAGDKVFRIICFIIMGVFALSYIMILINMIFGSFRTTTAFSQKPFNFSIFRSTRSSETIQRRLPIK